MRKLILLISICTLCLAGMHADSGDEQVMKNIPNKGCLSDVGKNTKVCVKREKGGSTCLDIKTVAVKDCNDTFIRPLSRQQMSISIDTLSSSDGVQRRVVIETEVIM